jgi:predicted metal-dependent hydrolase
MDAGTRSNEPADAPRMKLRRPPFSYVRRSAGHWNAARPEFAQIVNAGSLAMPYLEPYLIKTMREARGRITDPKLAAELDLYCGQESAHYRQHRIFNDTLKAQGYRSVEAIEAQLAADYARLGAEKSLAFNLAYAEGFESMALAIGHMLIEDREFLFGGGESGVASLVLWHFVEEIEHKNVAFDVFEHVVGGYGWRVFGLAYATGHIFWRTRGAYHALLKEDGLWRDLRSRMALARLLARIFAKLVPRMLRILNPRYHPARVADPAWALAWARLFQADAAGAARLDTGKLSAPEPVALSA